MNELTSVAESAVTEGFDAAAAVVDVPSGWVLKVSVGGREIALANHEGEFLAVDNSCTHAGGPLGDTKLKPNCQVECPWHNSVFDARTGEVVSGPARKAIKTYQTRVIEGLVFVRIG